MDRNPPTPSGTPAPYGHACVSCAQSKCKCIIRPVGGPCERCYRLNRECRPGESVRRRNHKRPAVTKPKKTARLEEKLDGLISLIKTGASGTSAVASPQPSASTGASPPNNGIQADLNGHPHHQSNEGSPSTDPNDHIHNIMSQTTDPDYTVSYEPSLAEAEEYLSNFKTYKLKYFPFVYIPSTTTAHQLQQEKPFLWLCIMAVGSKSTLQQQILGKRIRQTVAQEMIIRSVKSMDLLLGLLAFIGWATYQVQREPFLSLFTQLAVSLVFDLGLTKPVLKDPDSTLCWNRKYSRPATPRTMEERRAVLSCFLITSIVSSFLQKIDALRWTPHMDDCLQKLSEENECPNDEVLVKQVQLQFIIEKTNQQASHDGAREPTCTYLESLHSQLQDVKESVLCKPQGNEVLLLHLYSAELETTLSPFLHGKPLTSQQETVNASLTSIKSWFDVFFTLTPDTYIGFPSSILSQLLRCLVTLYRLRVMSDLACVGDSVEVMDPLLLLDRVVSNMEQVEVLSGLDNRGVQERDIFFRAAQMFRALRPGWETELRSKELALSNNTMPQNFDEVPMQDFLGMDFLDIDWITDFYVPPN
ncbi:hypothetical protein F5Y00DRAFT_249993 [Daldinia vernicosa]|uniref:uncharacterized protein n=1 Tax=Daldinia vernicosa TaxID=114800 RepID=UPI0020074819|nr:uncharacterized protein F5Y00DRAFT_249993 [Daldinia vernicosa]KAI0843906.1 hypothetical protein F5Y00DRAFT_249993 [Daldinia vernicosa]